MKRLLFVLGLVFIVITTSRIAAFSGGGFLGWTIAIGLAVSVYVMAYVLEEDGKVNYKALTMLIFLALVDGFFNFSETIRWSMETGRWDIAMSYGERQFYIYRVSDFILGIFPTVTAAGTAWVARSLEKKERKLSKGWKKDLQDGLVKAVLGYLPEGSGTLPEVEKPARKRVEGLPEWLPVIPQSKEEFRQLCQEGIISLPEDVTSLELAKHLPVSDRSVRNWLAYAKNGHGK